ncbi:MAG: hypothetical protein CM1200mP2_57090 [Planctomycetaceae bacterium]|nr:MAG: hypothetical protein CM1200mP2_57090 [Planctomycetaceae bacterium]
MNRRCQALAGLVGVLVFGGGFELPAPGAGLGHTEQSTIRIGRDDGRGGDF